MNRNPNPNQNPQRRPTETPKNRPEDHAAKKDERPGQSDPRERGPDTGGGKLRPDSP
ncbi:MAG TPA: hypothetical protein VF132_12450 [Rudaea sp.]